MGFNKVSHNRVTKHPIRIILPNTF